MFTDEETLIYGPYDRGDGIQVLADPVDVQEHLASLLGGDPNQLLRACRDGDPAVSYPAWKQMSRAAAEAFGLVLFDPTTGQGLRLDQVRVLVNDFVAWCVELKKKRADTPTPSPSLASPRAAYSTTARSSDCGCS